MDTIDKVGGFIVGTLSNTSMISGTLHDASVGISGTTTIPDRISENPEYEGEYSIVPIVGDAQILDTRNKVLRDDVVIAAIPDYSVSNEFGTTFIIGG